MATHQLHTDHARLFEGNRFVYPVLSRRSGGISIGVNLNPDKICNFDCIYCQVDRRSQSETRFVEIAELLEELRTTLRGVASGAIYQHPKFSAVPSDLRRLNDIAFSGDGEPTTYKNFDELMEECAGVKRTGLQADSGNSTNETTAGYHRVAVPGHGDHRTSSIQHQDSTIQHPASSIQPDDVKMVLITNASMFHRPHVERGLAILDENQGEIWAKLDAGTAAYYHFIERTPIPFQRILDNITAAARVRPIVIQSLFMRVEGVPPSQEELEAYCERLGEIIAAGGRIKLVQIYTVARRPAESIVSPLGDHEVDGIVALVRERTGLRALPFYGSTDY